MIKARKLFSGFAFLFALAATGMLCACLGTSYFIDAAAENVGNRTSEVKVDCSDYSDVEVFTMCTHFGLFTGIKSFNLGFGTREPENYKVFTEHKGVYNLNINIAVIVCILCAIIFGLVATVFGLVNTLTVPIETIHGPTGLYIWNAIGGLFSGAGWVLYLVLYLTELQTNVLSEVDKSRNFETDSVNLGASYWLLIVSCGLFICNIPLAYFTSLAQDPDYMWRLKKGHDLSESTNKVDVGLGLMY